MSDVNEIRDRLSTSSFDDQHFTAAVAILSAEYAVSSRISAVLSTFDMIMADWTVLTIIKVTGGNPLQLGKIAELLRVHATTVTNAVERLERSGYVSRISDSADRRTTYVTLSSKGDRQLTTIQAALGKTQFGLGALSAEEAEQLVRLLSKVRKRTEAEVTEKQGATRVRKRARVAR